MLDTSIGHVRRVTHPPSPQEQQQHERDAEQARQASMRPADKSVAAVQSALDAIVAERAMAAHRVSACKAAMEAFNDGRYHAPADVRAAQDCLELAEIDLAQYERMEAGMRVSLIRAQEAETEAKQALAASVPAAQAAVTAWRVFIDKEYPRLAGALAKGLKMEVAAEQAHAVLQTAAATLPDHDAPLPLPRVGNGVGTEAYRWRASLPGTDVVPLAKWAGPVAPVQY